MNRLRKGDTVEMLAGRDRGRRGVISAILGSERALVEGINVMKRHTRPNPMANNPGGVISKIKSVHVSNLMLVNPTSDKPERVKVRINSAGKRERFFKSNDAVL